MSSKGTNKQEFILTVASYWTFVHRRECVDRRPVRKANGVEISNSMLIFPVNHGFNSSVGKIPCIYWYVNRYIYIGVLS
jgi:hypothetical protein